MLPTDKPDFTAIIAKTWRFYDRAPNAETVANWFDLLEDIPLEAIASAFKRHITNPDVGQYLPKPADIIRNLSDPKNDHPGAEEAWGLLTRLVLDEGETGCLTEEIRVGWRACSPMLTLGDEVGARMCFLETYRKAVILAKEAGRYPNWSPTIGHDPKRRKMALQSAVEDGRISADQARALCPELTENRTNEKLLGLDHPATDPPPQSSRWRQLVAQCQKAENSELESEMQKLTALLMQRKEAA